MIEIAALGPGKWGYFNQIIFNANKMAFVFEKFFCFSQAPLSLSHCALVHCTQALHIARLNRSQPGYTVNRKLETKSKGRFSLFVFHI